MAAGGPSASKTAAVTALVVAIGSLAGQVGVMVCRRMYEGEDRCWAILVLVVPGLAISLYGIAHGPTYVWEFGFATLFPCLAGILKQILDP